MTNNHADVQGQESSSAAGSNNCLLEGSIVAFLSVLLACIGVGVAVRIFTNYEIPWQRYVLLKPPKGTIEISGVDFHSYLDEPAGDEVHVRTADGAVYSNTLFEDTWQFVVGADAKPTSQPLKCAPAWSEQPSDAPIWDPPPIKKTVLDSAGARFEHSMAIAVRCYVLYDDGSLELWTRYDDFRSSAPLIFGAPLLGGFGALAGLVIGFLVVWGIRRRRRRTES